MALKNMLMCSAIFLNQSEKDEFLEFTIGGQT